jgi:hypothetical protein
MKKFLKKYLKMVDKNFILCYNIYVIKNKKEIKIMIIFSNGKQINLPNNNKSIVENWLDYARQSENEYEQIMLGANTMLFTQKHNGEFYVEFAIKEDTAVEFGDYAINLSQYDNATMLDKLQTYYNEIKANGVERFIKQHINELV